MIAGISDAIKFCNQGVYKNGKILITSQLCMLSKSNKKENSYI